MNRRTALAAGASAAALGLLLPRARGSEPYTKGLLWRIEATDVEPSHVFGTLHAEDPRLRDLPAPAREAFAQARSLMLEYYPDQYSRERFLEAALYLDDRTLVQDLGEADFERAVEAMQPIGLARDFIRRLKPWGVLLNLRISRQPSGGESPESQLFRLARARRVPVMQIENVEEQIFTFDEMSSGAQVGLLRYFLAHRDELDTLAERSLRAYLARDLEGLWVAQQEFARRRPEIKAHHAELMRRVVTDRSVVMAYRMQRELRRGGAFVAVGALHLYGGRGVLALLEEDGYRARRVY